MAIRNDLTTIFSLLPRIRGSNIHQKMSATASQVVVLGRYGEKFRRIAWHLMLRLLMLSLTLELPDTLFDKAVMQAQLLLCYIPPCLK